MLEEEKARVEKVKIQDKQGEREERDKYAEEQQKIKQLTLSIKEIKEKYQLLWGRQLAGLFLSLQRFRS